MINEAFYILTGKQLGKIPYPENAQTARETASEGMVLLKNDGTLPFRGKNIALYGVGAIDTIVCGSGSGYAFSPYTVSIRKGLENAGIQISSVSYLKRYRK